MRTIEMFKPAAVVLAAAAIMAGFSSVSAAYGAPAAPLPQFTSGGPQLEDLSDLLLETEEFAAITGATGARTLGGPFAEPYNSAAGLDSPSCASAYTPAEKSSYAGSGYRDLSTTIVLDAARQNSMTQAVIRFPDHSHISTYANNLKEQWVGCANRELTHTDADGSASRWQVGEPTVTSNKVLVLPLHSLDNGVTCQRAAGGIGAIFIDVLACATEATDYGEATVVAIAGKTNAHR
ncbi:MAG: sensor domain-containing protein [Actinomycetia bacterium]|nr:sensor domain-containing protein [Actinomycetes bacterium]